MNKPKFKTVLLIAFICSLNQVFGQQFFTAKEPNYSSPNAASLGKYGDIPVSYHTGVPNISVPVFTIHEGQLTLPITLNYHSSGVLVNEVASWIGLGWSLSAGGMINQTIIGGPDEGKANINTSWGETNRGHWGWYKDGGMPPEIINCQATPIDGVNGYDASGNKCANGYPSPTCYPCLSYYKQAAMGDIDTEPDLFTYNFNGQSGKFFFDENKKVHSTPENDLYIKPVDSPTIFSEWVIITPDGTKYRFGTSAATETAYTDPLNYNNGTSENNKSSKTWYLYRIESADGQDWIAFQYADEYYSYGNRHQQSVSFDGYGNLASGNVNMLDGTLVSSMIKGKRLTKITTSSGDVQIDFNPSTASRLDLSYANATGSANLATATNALSLAQIMITYGGKTKYFNLGQSYFIGSPECHSCGWPLIDDHRLRLDWVQETDGTTTLPKYELTYNPTTLPRRYSLARDEWEYYNGHQENDGLIPSDRINKPGSDVPIASGDSRVADENSMQAGILTQIKYPTGGYSAFEYEAHRETSTSPIVGGLRIKTITDNNGQGTVRQKNFTYGTGLLFYGTGWPYYTHDLNNPQRDNFWQQQPGDDYGYLLNSSPNPATWSAQGYHIGYYDVTVEETGNGKTTYHYYNEAAHSAPDMQYPMIPLVAGGTSGELLIEQSYANGNANPTSRTDYNKLPGTLTKVDAKRVVSANHMPPHDRNGNPLWDPQNFMPLYTNYTITTSRFRLMSKTVTRDGVSALTTYEYGNDTDMPTAEVSTGSNGVTYRKEITYPNSPGSGAPSVMFDPTTGDNYKHMIGDATKQTLLVNGTVSQQSTNQFTVSNNNVYLTNSKVYPTGGTNYTEKNYVYDTQGNLQIVEPSNGTNTTFLWGYNSKHLIATAKNATFQQTTATIPKTASFGTGISTNTGSCTNLTGTFSIDIQQNITFAPTIHLNGASGLSVKLTLTRISDGTVVFGPKTYTDGTYSESISQLPAGTYQFCYQSFGFPSPYTNYSSIDVLVNYSGTIYRANVFHTSFEEDGVSSTNPKTGNKVWQGALQLATPSQPGKYILSYWLIRSPSAQWVYQEQVLDYTTTTPPNQITVGQSGDIIDELRLYPVDAQMTTYTYDPVVGITSMTDAKNMTTYYEYDSSQRLMNIKDKDGNIIKSYTYHYQGQ